MILLIAIIMLVLCGVAVATATIGLVLPAARSSARLREIEAYGYGADPAGGVSISGEQVGNRSVLLELATRVGGKLSPNGYIDHIRTKLIAAGLYNTDPRAIVGVQALGAAVLGGLTIALGIGGNIFVSLLLALLAGALACAFPYVAVYGRASRRLDKIDRGLPDLIDMIVVTMEAGLGFGASLDAASTRLSGPVGYEIRLTIQEHRMGLALNEALLHMLKRCETPNMQSFVRSVTQGEILGVSMGTIMRNLAVEMRVKRRQAAEEQAQKAPVKMLFPLIFLMFPALGIVILGPALFEISDKLGGLGGP